MTRKTPQHNTTALVCAAGIGDALISLVLAHNLEHIGHQVDTYSTLLCELKEWFPDKSILPFPKSQELQAVFSPYERVIAADYSLLSTNPFENTNLSILKEENFDKSKTLVDNLLIFAKTQLHIDKPIAKNGIRAPRNLSFQAFPKRIVLHPEATAKEKTWSAKGFLNLANKLVKKGWHPAICVSPRERPKWERLLKKYPYIDFPKTPTLSEVAAYIYESRVLIGNDSGLGHLASCMGLPTISIFARGSYARLWRPGFGKNTVVTPLPLLIGARLKSKHWQKTLFSQQVLRTFLSKNVKRTR